MSVMMSTPTRWSQFEAEVAAFLRSGGFEVTQNAKAARPRQTDIFGKADDLNVLVEAKNQKRKVGIAEVDSLRSRLGRVSPDVVGAIFTTSGLTSEAIKGIEANRKQPIVAFVREEIEHLRNRQQNVRTLIDRKRAELLVQGRAWFGTEVHNDYVGIRLPRSSTRFRVGNDRAVYFECKSSFDGATYSLEIPDTGWGNIGGEGARLSLQLELSSLESLRNIFGYLEKYFGLTKNGAFSIKQSEVCWYGFGAEEFLQTARGWRTRYSISAAGRFHHSEELIYFDQFEGGWIELSAQQRIPDFRGEAPFLHHS